MIGLAVKPSIGGVSRKAFQEAFFDRAAVIKAVDRGRRRALARSGGYVRTVARNSMRRDARPSPPGRPPRVKTGLLKANIFHAYDARTNSVVIGPAALSNRPVAPERLEFGARFSVKDRWIPEHLAPGRDAKGRFERRTRWTKYTGPVTLAPRPYMLPALQRSENVIAANFRDQIY